MPGMHQDKEPSPSLEDLRNFFYNDRSSRLYQHQRRISAQLAKLQPSSPQEVRDLLEFALYSGASLETKQLAAALGKVVAEALSSADKIGALKSVRRITECVGLAVSIYDTYLHNRDTQRVKRGFEKACVDVAEVVRNLERLKDRVETAEKENRGRRGHADLICAEVQIRVALAQLARC